jgi:hypothetical protein
VEKGHLGHHDSFLSVWIFATIDSILRLRISLRQLLFLSLEAAKLGCFGLSFVSALRDEGAQGARVRIDEFVYFDFTFQLDYNRVLFLDVSSARNGSKDARVGNGVALES